MRKGDIYRHFKGNDYVFLGISVPMFDIDDDYIKSKLKPLYKSFYSELPEREINVYHYKGILVANTECPMVLYHRKNEDRETIWARPVDLFYGEKHFEDGSSIKRFTLTGVRDKGIINE